MSGRAAALGAISLHERYTQAIAHASPHPGRCLPPPVCKVQGGEHDAGGDAPLQPKGQDQAKGGQQQAVLHARHTLGGDEQPVLHARIQAMR